MRFVFVPGACHGAWAWQKVLPFFNNSVAIDLPRAPTARLQDHAERILQAAGEKAVLVGHSAGGYAITAAAEHAPDRVAGLIYLCAYIPPATGQSLATLRRGWPDPPLDGAFRRGAASGTYGFRPDLLEDLFYHDCPAGTATTARDLLTDEPIGPQETPLPLRHTPTLPRAAIICTEDRALPPAFQRAMAAGLPTLDLPSAHSPFFSMPERLAGAIAQLAARMM